MAESEETLKQEPTLADVMRELVKINQRLDAHDSNFKAIDAQFEATLEGIEHNKRYLRTYAG